MLLLRFSSMCSSCWRCPWCCRHIQTNHRGWRSRCSWWRCCRPRIKEWTSLLLQFCWWSPWLNHPPPQSHHQKSLMQVSVQLPSLQLLVCHWHVFSCETMWMQMPGVVCRHIGWIEVEKLQLNESPGKNRKISQPKNRQRRGRGTLPPARSLSPVKTTQTKQAKKRSRGPTQKMTFQVTSGSSTAIYCHRNSLCNNKEMKLSAKGAAFGISEIVSCSINSCVRHRLCCLWQKIGTVPCQSPLRFRSEVLFISHPHFTSVHQSSRVSLGWLVPVSVNRKGQIEPSAFFDEEAEQVRWSFLKIRRRRTKLLRWQTVHCALYVQVARVLVCRNVGAKQMCLKRMLDHLQMKTLLAAHGAEKSSWNQREHEAKPQHILWKHKKRRSGSFSQLGLEPNHTGLRAQSLFFLEELCRVKRSDTHKVLKLLKLLQESSQASKSVLPASPNKTSSAQTHK